MTTVVLIAFMLISPGFCLVTGMRMGSRYGALSETSNTTLQIIAFIVLTIILQLLFITVYLAVLELITVCSAVLGFTLDPLLSFPNTIKEFFIQKEGFYWRNWFIFMPYILLSYGLSFYIGTKIIKSVEKRIASKKLRTSFFHGPLYELIVQRRGPVNPMCSIVTKTEYQGFHIMYSGFFEGIAYKEKHQIKYVILTNVKKLLLDFGKNRTKIQEEKNVSSGAGGRELFYIDGDEISNILFSEIPISSIEQEQLDILLNRDRN